MVSKPVTKPKQRESNMELFRCFAMFLVVAAHVNFFSISVPTTVDVHQAALPSFIRFLCQALCIGCVDMFVLLSGWFGIRPRLKGFCNLMFQVFFCVTLVYLVLVAVGLESFSVRDFALSITGGWFVRAYIGLYILAPVMNAFIEKASRRQQETFLAAYFVFQMLCGWIMDSANFAWGYSTASFIFLYMLARYIRIYHCETVKRPPRNIYLAVYVVIASIQGFAALILQSYGIEQWERLYCHTSPTVITMSLAMLLYFSRLNIRSRIVNWVAASSFSVYLLHSCLVFTLAKYKAAAQYLFHSYSGISYLLAILAFIVAVYAAATLFDKVRIVCWNIIAKRLGNNKRY